MLYIRENPPRSTRGLRLHAGYLPAGRHRFLTAVKISVLLLAAVIHEKPRKIQSEIQNSKWNTLTEAEYTDKDPDTKQ